MNLLALDTSTLACSVALAAGGRQWQRHELRAREHTRLLVPMIDGLLAEAGIRAADLDAVVLGNGPGSFIGMRIAASLAQGLCFGAGCPLVPVSSLAAVALEAMASADCSRVLVAQDAHMNEVYLAGFEKAADGLPLERISVRLQPADSLDLQAAGYVAAGDGWNRYPELYAANRSQLGGRSDVLYPHANELLRLGQVELQRGGGIAAETLEPEYVREKVAVPAADRAGT
jgi:tRNA threonylcarbamoyladenosine biosynthesis protein TsaB